jgi:hypothetical protein
MLTIATPKYSKITNPKTGAQESLYIFSINCGANMQPISFIAESESDINLQSLQKTILENINWWNIFINQFLGASAKYFTKTYTVDQINKITKHTLNGNITTKTYPMNILLLPTVIQISGSTFIINWNYTTESIIIDIPVENNTNEIIELPVSNDNKVLEGIQELNIDELPVGGNSTDEALELDSPAKFYEKQRVKEMRLKAKLAVYKAQRQMAQYYEKYGDSISDSDSDFETSDEESDNDFEDEEVQL